tara:strand:+ start:306 stop:557 length:252 start_codon:yes stop_codon:yes gene_type:complete
MPVGVEFAAPDGAIGEGEAVRIAVKLEFGRVVKETDVKIEVERLPGLELSVAVTVDDNAEVPKTEAIDGTAPLDNGSILNAGS